jgi:hypothetical protein
LLAWRNLACRFIPTFCLLTPTNLIALGPENIGEDRIVVFVTVHPANVASSYDGFEACDEIQFPLLLAIRANTPELRQKFIHLLLARYHICFNADPLALERLPKPDYNRIRALLKRSSLISSQLLQTIASDFPSFSVYSP